MYITEQQKTDFYRHKNGYNVISTSKTNKPKPTHGKLVLVDRNGRNEVVVKNDLPFPLLQTIKKQMIANGYQSKCLIIRNI